MAATAPEATGVRAALRQLLMAFAVLIIELRRSITGSRSRAVATPAPPFSARRHPSGPPQVWLDYVAAHDPVWIGKDLTDVDLDTVTHAGVWARDPEPTGDAGTNRAGHLHDRFPFSLRPIQSAARSTPSAARPMKRPRLVPSDRRAQTVGTTVGTTNGRSEPRQPDDQAVEKDQPLPAGEATTVSRSSATTDQGPANLQAVPVSRGPQTSSSPAERTMPRLMAGTSASRQRAASETIASEHVAARGSMPQQVPTGRIVTEYGVHTAAALGQLLPRQSDGEPTREGNWPELPDAIQEDSAGVVARIWGLLETGQPDAMIIQQRRR